MKFFAPIITKSVRLRMSEDACGSIESSAPMRYPNGMLSVAALALESPLKALRCDERSVRVKNTVSYSPNRTAAVCDCGSAVALADRQPVSAIRISTTPMRETFVLDMHPPFGHIGRLG